MGDRESKTPRLEGTHSLDEHVEPSHEAAAAVVSDSDTVSEEPNTNHVIGSRAINASTESIELEEALGYLASKKTWHFLIFLAIALFDIPFAFNLMAPVFLAGSNTGRRDEPCWKCKGDEHVSLDQQQPPELFSVSQDQCKFAMGSADLNYSIHSNNSSWQRCTQFESVCSEPYGNTIVTEFKLFCHDSKWIEIGISLFYLGVLMGSFFTNSMSDRFGRKWIVLGGLCLQACVGILTGLLPSFPVFVAGRFVQGLIAKAVGYVSYVMCLEFLPIKLRTFYGILYNFVWVTGYCMVGVLAYFCHDWRTLTLTMNGLLIVFIGHCWFLPESPQFYMASNQIEKAKNIIVQGAKINRIPFNFRLQPSIEENSNEAVGTRVYTPLDLVRTPRIRLYFFMVSSLWFVNNLGYYMLSLASTRWGGNIYVSYCLGGIVELPAYAVSFVLAEKYGRKWTLVAAEWILAVLCILLGYFNSYLPESQAWIVIATGISCKFFVGITFSILLLIGTEVFPTVVRGIAVGACTLLGDFGSVMAPTIFFTDEIYSPLPYILVGVASALGGSSVVFIAETWHRPLPVTIHDTEVLHLRKPVSKEQLKANDFHHHKNELQDNTYLANHKPAQQEQTQTTTKCADPQTSEEKQADAKKETYI